MAWTRTTLMIFLVFAWSNSEARFTHKKFPPKDKFWFGVATASYQVEGAWNEDGKGENIWDHLCHTNPTAIAKNQSGDIACDSYHKVEEDLAIIKDLGVDHYRFSISWSRLLPTAYTNNVNPKAVKYYNRLIDGLLENNIQPMVTIFHWDTPQVLEEEGGFQNDIIINLFADYARTCFKLFGDRVKYWLTFNEPDQTCSAGYGYAQKAPMKKSPGIGEYLCIHNVVRAHAKVWHIYDKEFRKSQNGHVGITLDSAFMIPENKNKTEDVEAAETSQQFLYGCYASPLFTGDYPTVMRAKIDARSKKQGFAVSRLPKFTEAEKRHLKGTADFLGVNCYTSVVVRPSQPENIGMGIYADSEVESYQPNDWQGSASSWLKVRPESCAGLVRWVHKTYNPKAIIITENGVSDNGTMNDDTRISYYKRYISQLRAVLDDGINLIGYTAWSVMDNFEWLMGYTEKFGLYSVNFDDPNRPRTAKKSAKWYKEFLQTRCLVEKCES